MFDDFLRTFGKLCLKPAFEDSSCCLIFVFGCADAAIGIFFLKLVVFKLLNIVDIFFEFVSSSLNLAYSSSASKSYLVLFLYFFSTEIPLT